MPAEIGLPWPHAVMPPNLCVQHRHRALATRFHIRLRCRLSAVPPPPPGRPSYAVATAYRPRMADIPHGSALGAEFVSPSSQGEAAPQSGVRMTGGGRSTTSRLVSTVFWTEAHQGRAGAPPIGLHGWDRVCHAKRKEDGAQAVAAVVVAQSGDDSSIVAGRRRTAAAAKRRRRRPSSGSGGVWGRLGYKP
jgi:hypothetical protein